MDILKRFKSNGQVGRNGTSYTATLDQLWDAEFVVKDMVAYNNNRALDENRVQSYADNFNPDHFGVILAVPVKRNGGYTLERRGGHHRMAALNLVHKRDGGLGTDGSCNATLYVFPTQEALSIYLAEGSAVGLKIKDLLINPDLAFASLIRDCIGLVDTSLYFGVKLITVKQYKQIASILYCMTFHDYNDFSVEKVLSGNIAQKVKQLSKIPTGDSKFTLKLGYTKKAQFVEAMNYALDVLKYVIKEGDSNKGSRANAILNDRASKFISSGYLFTYLVWNKLVEGEVTKIKSDNLGRALMVKDGQLIKDAINALGSKDFNSFEEKIYAIARTKQGYVRNDNSLEF